MDTTDIEEWQEWWARNLGSKLCCLLGHKVENSWCSRCWRDVGQNKKIWTRRPDHAQSLVGRTTAGLEPPFGQGYHRRVRATPPAQNSAPSELDNQPPTEAPSD
jgi:hypothetical protein